MFFSDNTFNDIERKGIISILDISKLRNVLDNDTFSFKNYVPVFFKTKKDISIERKLIGILSKAQNISNDLNEQMKKYRITNDIKAVENLLNSDLVVSYILSGADGVQYIMYPMVLEFINNKDIKVDKKVTFVKRLKLDLKRAMVINNADMLPSRKKIGGEGIAYFTKTIKNVVAPYNL